VLTGLVGEMINAVAQRAGFEYRVFAVRSPSAVYMAVAGKDGFSIRCGAPTLWPRGCTTLCTAATPAWLTRTTTSSSTRSSLVRRAQCPSACRMDASQNASDFKAVRAWACACACACCVCVLRVRVRACVCMLACACTVRQTATTLSIHDWAAWKRRNWTSASGAAEPGSGKLCSQKGTALFYDMVRTHCSHSAPTLHCTSVAFSLPTAPTVPKRPHGLQCTLLPPRGSHTVPPLCTAHPCTLLTDDAALRCRSVRSAENASSPPPTVSPTV
jgi:hypothetical protein